MIQTSNHFSISAIILLLANEASGLYPTTPPSEEQKTQLARAPRSSSRLGLILAGMLVEDLDQPGSCEAELIHGTKYCITQGGYSACVTTRIIGFVAIL